MAIRLVVSGPGNMGRQVLAAVDPEADREPTGVLETVPTDRSLGAPGRGGLGRWR